MDGKRLASLLRVYRDGSVDAPSGPTVVTIASCDSGQQGTVIGAGASVAHELHEAGIPFVVAAQFPLTFEASVLMARVMYRGLAWGYDPRIILNDLRLQLRAKQPDGYDWASLVAYAALPHNLELQLSPVRFERISRSIEQTLKLLDAYIDEQLETQHQLRHDNAESQERRALAESRRKDALRHLQRLLSQTPTRRRTQRSQIHGLLASTEKRRAGMALVHSAADAAGCRRV